MIQSYKKYLNYANILAIIFHVFLNILWSQNNPPLLPNKAALLDDKAGLFLSTCTGMRTRVPDFKVFVQWFLVFWFKAVLRMIKKYFLNR
jgi:hypothetical protein